MIILKTIRQIDNIRQSCTIVADILQQLKKDIRPGITTNHLNNMAEELCYEKKAVPGFKGYRGFPYSICASANDTVVHGFPNDKPLQEGDVLSIDFGVIYKGWYGDSAFTVGVGKTDKDTKDLLSVGYNCLLAGIKAAKPNAKLGNISFAIQSLAEENNYSVIRDFVGHGIGRNLHEEPQVPNYGDKNEGYILKPGTVIAIEPMISFGTGCTKVLPDGWTTKTKDNTLAVHFEHTIAITGDGVKILTEREEELINA